MDAITTALVGALTNLSTSVVKDSYESLKGAILKKFGAKSDLATAVEKLQEAPDSKGRREVLKEEVAKAKADTDSEILSLAHSLIEKLRTVAPTAFAATNINQTAGNDAVQVGQARDVSFQK